MASRAPLAVAILGPTAAGKTALALELAQHRPIEIISIDSALVYREMDIGTAKPSAAEQATVAHHLIDIRNPDEVYSAADFASDATRLIGQIRGRGAVPVLVGGTMMYYKALTMGLDDLPAADAQVRADLEAQAAEVGWPTLHARLAQVDPVTAQRLAPRDSQRIQRALEVFALTGKPLSSFHQRGDAAQMDLSIISLEPEQRADLHARIALRFEQMLAGGLIEEVQGLRQRWPGSQHQPSMRCVGYRQVCEMLDGVIDPSELKDRGVFATRQLAKRQLTWLRSMPQRASVDPFSRDGLRIAVAWCVQQCDALLDAGHTIER